MTSIFAHSSRALLAVLLSSALGASAATFTFTNAQGMAVPAPGGTGNPAGAPASVYPSVINVGGLNGRVSGVSVRLRNFTHGAPDDVDILLVGPNGTNLLLMSDAGGAVPAANVALTFSPGAVAPISVPLASGIYRPSNNGQGDPFPGAPPPSAATTLDIFNGSNPNGAWQLFVVDDNPNNNGGINGWELTLDITQAPFIVAPPQSKIVPLGATVDFSVNVVGAPVLQYQWHVNCRNVHNGTNAALTVTNVSFEDIGNYSVTVSNPFGQLTSSDATLSLDNPPGPLIKTTVGRTSFVLDWPLRDVPYRLEELAEIKPLSQEWNPSDADLSFSSNRLSAGIDFKAAHKFFRVAPPNVKILNAPGGRAVNFDENVVFSVNATGTPPFLYQWRLNGSVIPGETNSILTFKVDGNSRFGAYQVAVQEATEDAALSRLAVLRPAGLETPLSDSFAGRPQFLSEVQSIHGTTFGATTEPGEPRHAGLPGVRSVWLTWKAPVDGIVTFDTIGSSFDTLLAAYTGQGFANLFPVASDDDSGSNVCSKIQFNTVEGTDYHVALDGLAGADGFFVLSWSFLPKPLGGSLPIFDVQPVDQIIQTNQTTTFFAMAHGIGQSSNVTYQWYFNGAPIPASFGGTNNVLRIGGPQPSFPPQVGEYFVDVANSTLIVRSRVASLQFSTDPQFRFVSKLLADTLCASGSADATNCCGGSFVDLGKSTPKLLSAAAGTLAGSLAGGGSGSANKDYWVWVTNGFTCTKSVTLTATVKVGNSHKGCSLEFVLLNGIVPLKSANGTSPRTFNYTFAADTLYVIGIGYNVASPTITLDYSSVACPDAATGGTVKMATP